MVLKQQLKIIITWTKIYHPLGNLNITIDKLYQELEEELTQIESQQEDILEQTESSISLVQHYMNRLKEFIIKYKFASTHQEIEFFKETKPRFFCRLIYFMKVYHIHLKRPTGGDEALKAYLQKQLRKLNRHFEENQEFYQYYRTKSTHLDNRYFIRGNYDIRLTLDSFHFETDPRFSTSHDYKVSKILANELLEEYLKKELNTIHNNSNTSFKPMAIPKVKIRWTESKASLVELIYAMHTANCLNDGSSDIKEIASYFEIIFNIKLGDYYGCFKQIKMRKTAQTKFLDTLAECLRRRIEESDDD